SDDAARVRESYGRPGRAVPAARAAGRASHQHDAHRVAAFAPAQVGLRLLHRFRGPRGRPACCQGAGGPEEALVAVSRAGFISAGGAVESRAMSEPQQRARYLVRPGGRVAGELTVPGDKSISHRALMLGGIAQGDTEITGFLAGEDCLATLRALQALGVRIERPEDEHVIVHGAGPGGLQAAAAALDMGNAGTAMRLFMGLLAGQGFDSTLVGDESLMRRPMERVALPLRLMGARILTRDGRP